MRDVFYGKNKCFDSYLVRKALASMAGVALMLFLLVAGMPILSHKTVIFCDLHSYQYECTGLPADIFLIPLIAGE